MKFFTILKDILMIIRNWYVMVMSLPLWLWSVYYDVSGSQNVHWVWLENQWSILCILVFLYGALAIWFFAEHAVETYIEEKHVPRSSVGYVWGLSITLFVAVLGAVLNSDGIVWGLAFFKLGLVILPIVAILAFFSYSHDEKEKKKEEVTSEPAAQSQEA
jgi:predicted permease